MRLTVEDNPRQLERYRHLKPAGALGGKACGAAFPDSKRTCTRRSGHRGPHAAHGRMRKVVAVWDSAAAGSAESERRRASGRSAPPDRRPVGLPSRRPGGLLRAIIDRILVHVTTVEDVAMLVLFLAFVGFAVHWLFLIAG